MYSVFDPIESCVILYIGDKFGIHPRERELYMAGYFGKIGEYDPSTENWATYVKRLQHIFSANNVDDALKKDAFLTCIGKETFGLLRALVVPAKLSDKTYDELVAALTAHFAPKPLIIAERFRFHKRDQ